MIRDFPGGPGVKTLPFNARSAGSITGWGTKIPYASWPKTPKQENRRKVVTNSIKNFKVVHISHPFNSSIEGYKMVCIKKKSFKNTLIHLINY